MTPSPPAPDRVLAERYLLELTGLPTAAGRESRVIHWIQAWVAARRNVTLTRDAFGNLLLQRRGVTRDRPIYFTAHLDHPAFVVTAVEGKQVIADFRGGVRAEYFVGSKVRGHAHRESPEIPTPTIPGTPPRPTPPGTIATYTPPSGETDAQVQVTFQRDPRLAPGDVLTWDLRPPSLRRGRLHAPACDDLAAVAGMFAAFHHLLQQRKTARTPDVRLLCTRAEEVGFIGAMAACRSGLITPDARLIALENSKSFADSPLGGGPIVRVGDRVSTFDPALTYRVAQVAQDLAAADESFKFQRKLMPGGACEATAYQTLGHTATCVCLPLANYHNMDETAGRIASESISLADYHHLVQLLVALGHSLDPPPGSTPPTDLRQRLDKLFEQRRSLLE